MLRNRLYRKILAAVVACMLLLPGIAGAEVPSLSDRLFSCAKTAVTALASGDYDRIVNEVPFSDMSPGADEWRSFAEGAFSSLRGTSPQTQYAVAYWMGNCWKVAVPVAIPEASGIEVLVLVSEDGSSFSGYGKSTWGQVTQEYSASSYVRWNGEYVASTFAIVESDEN